MKRSIPISSNTFWGTPFLEKGPPKITEGGPFDPHWPSSRINPDYPHVNQYILCFLPARGKLVMQQVT